MTILIILFLLLVPLIALFFSIRARFKPPDKLIISLLVLGDLGHSPRMQYHAISLSKRYKKVYFIGYRGSTLSHEILDNPKIEIVYVPTPARMGNATGIRGNIRYVITGVWRVIKQALDVGKVLMSNGVERSGLILVQVRLRQSSFPHCSRFDLTCFWPIESASFTNIGSCDDCIIYTGL